MAVLPVRRPLPWEQTPPSEHSRVISSWPTNLETESQAVVRFYNKRGTAERWIKEGKQEVKMTRLSCHRFRSNEVRLWLSVLAYNLGTSGGGWCCRRGSRTGR
jgi:Transposase DDE domain group 1